MGCREFTHARDQSTFDVHRAAVDVREVVLEADDRARILQRRRAAESFMQHVAAHAGVVLMDEPVVGPDEAAGTWRQLTGINRLYRMPCDDLFEQGLGF